ncbi:MAG: hypothetical protein JWM33_2448, partial [Caulobacteraceae bacterium]|nr:hypothetical protein [Caulobacteraceae bacterium]
RTLASLVPSGALKAPSVAALVKEVVDTGDAGSRIKAGARLTDKPVLMLTADDGGVVFTRPFEDTVRGAGGGRLLTLHHVDSTDHSWTVYAPQMLDWVTEWLKPLE